MGSEESGTGVHDSVVQGDIHLGDKVVNNTSIVSGRRKCGVCGASGNHTFFICSTKYCENEYCEYCDHKFSKKCKICFDFENEIESKNKLLQKTIKDADQYIEITSRKLKAEKDDFVGKLSAEKDELVGKLSAEKDELFDYTSLISKQRTSYIHFSNNIQLIALLTLLSFSDFILNTPHAFELVAYSFAILVLYNFTSNFSRDNEKSLIYLLDIVVVLLVLLISLGLSHYFSGGFAIILFCIALGFFTHRLIRMLDLVSKKSYLEIKDRIYIDFSAVSYLVCLLYYLIFHFITS